jgi:hypothetical protein
MTFVNSLKKYLPEIVFFIVFIAIQIYHLNADFWNDEIYTLKNFVFTNLSTTIGDYHVPNNHIFFNVLNNIFLKIFGPHSLFDLMDQPFSLRLLNLFYAIVCLGFVYLFAARFISRKAALLSMMILMTTVPYFNFAMQIRGYGLSAMLLIICLYYCFDYIENGAKQKLIWLGLSGTLLIYTIPSNLYFTLTIGSFFTFYGLYDFFKSKLVYMKIFHVFSAFALAHALALVLFIPIFQEVFLNEYVSSGRSFRFALINYFSTFVSNGFVSNRWFLLALGILGLLLNYKYLKSHKNILICLSLFLFPIIIIFVRADEAPLRAFVPSMPILSILLAIGLNGFIEKFVKHEKYEWIFVLAVFFYSLFCFKFGIDKISKHVYNALESQERPQDLYHQYYNFHYQPLNDIRKFSAIYKENPLPVLIMGCEPHGIPNYLEKFGIPIVGQNDDNYLHNTKTPFYLITNHANKFLENDKLNVQLLSKDLTYHTLLKCN